MTIRQTEFIDAEEAERYAKPPGARPDWFVVVAFNSLGCYWSLRKGAWSHIDGAHESVANLSGIWTHVRIVKIPGEPDADAAPLTRENS